MAKNPILMLAEGNGSLTARDRDGTFSLTGAGALRYAAAPGARINRSINSRFASNTSGWSQNASGGINGSITQVSDPRFAGGTACRVVATANNAANGIRQVATVVPLCTEPASQATISFDIIVESGRKTGLQAGVSGHDASDVFVSSSGLFAFDVSVSDYNVLERKSVTANVAANHQLSSKFVFYIINNALEDTQFLVSNIVVEYGSVPSATYFEGPFLDPRTGQLGTPHASPSVERAQFWVEEATTNLAANPSAKVNVTNQIGATVNSVISRDTTSAYLGTASVKAVTSGVGVGEGINWYSLGSLGLTGSARTYIGSVWAKGTGNLKLSLHIRYTDTTSTDAAISFATLSNGWQRFVSGTAVANAAKTIDFVRLTLETTGAAQAVTFRGDCAQIEEKAYATSYCDGSLGTGYSWAGTAHASASTRAVTSVSRPKADVIASGFSSISGSWIARVLVPSDEGKFTTILSESDGYGSSDWLGLSYSTGGVLRQRSKVQANAEVSASSLGLVVYGSAYIAYGGWSDSVFVAVDSEPAVSASRVDTATNDVGVITFGGAGVEVIDGYLGPVAIYDRPLTDAERAKLGAAIDTWTPLWRLLGSNRYNQFQLRPIGA